MFRLTILAFLVRLLPAALVADALHTAATLERWSPVLVGAVVAWSDPPELTRDLRKVCRRESRCQELGVHDLDAGLSRAAWAYQVSVGHLDRACQPYHGGWATRGAWGLSAAAHWPYMPKCYQPEDFDDLWVSARVARQKWLRHCDARGKGRRWCPTRGWCPTRPRHCN